VRLWSFFVLWFFPSDAWFFFETFQFWLPDLLSLCPPELSGLGLVDCRATFLSVIGQRHLLISFFLVSSQPFLSLSESEVFSPKTLTPNPPFDVLEDYDVSLLIKVARGLIVSPFVAPDFFFCKIVKATVPSLGFPPFFFSLVVCQGRPPPPLVRAILVHFPFQE